MFDAKNILHLIVVFCHVNWHINDGCVSNGEWTNYLESTIVHNLALNGW